jgi:trigger factor
MQVSVEAAGNIRRRMTVALPAERVEKEYSARLQRVSRTARFPGFRPGKAPLKMVEAQYGGRLMDEVAGELIEETFREAVSSQGLRPAGGPVLERKVAERGRDFEYTVLFEVYPEIERLDIAGRRIERPVASVTDADVDRTLESLREQRVSYHAAERAAAAGDQLTVDFIGRVDGEPFEGGQASDYRLVLGESALIPGFEDGLTGARAGEERALELRFPDDYRNTHLAGRNAQFSVTVKTVAEPVLPEVDAEFARQLGIADGDVDTLRREVRANLERELADRVRTRVRDQVFATLLEINTFEVPQALVEAEIGQLVKQMQANLAGQGLPAEAVPRDPAVYRDQALRRVRLGLVLAEFVKRQSLIADAQAVRERVEQMAASYEVPQKFIDWHYAQPGRLSDIESLVLEEKAVALLLDGAKVEDVPMSFEELTRPRPQS